MVIFKLFYLFSIETYRSLCISFRIFRGIEQTHRSYHVLARSIPLSYSKLSRSYVNGTSEARPREKKKNIDPRREKMIECLRARDVIAAEELLTSFDTKDDHKNIGVLSQLITVFTKKEHIQTVNNIINRIKSAGVVPSEAAFSSLIRCHSDAKDIDGALAVIKFMLEHKVETKIRTLQPILDNMMEINDVPRIAVLLKHLSTTVDVRPEQLTFVLNLIAKNTELILNDAVKVALEEFITHCSQKVLGLPTEDIQLIASRFNKITLEEQMNQGVLVEYPPDYYIVDNSKLKTEGYLTVKVQHYDSPVSDFQEALPSIVNTDPSNPIVSSEEKNLTEVDERIFIRSEYDTIRKSVIPMKSRIVNMDTRTCRCPNCNATLPSLTLTEDEKAKVRQGLRNISSEVNEHLNDFKDFLQNYLEFDYIVDAANVAYFGQNEEYSGKKFSFKQIELVVNKLREKSSRILIVLPSCYTNPKFPNSITGGFNMMTSAEKKILDHLYEIATVYLTPRGNDDWFWVYASVLGKRRSPKPTFIVSNDLTRDHKIAFPNSYSFTRWRLTQMVYYDIFQDDFLDSKAVETEVFLYEPSKFSRLIQKNPQPKNGELRWHIPSIDRSSWLCVHTGLSPPVKVTEIKDMMVGKRNVTLIDHLDAR